jgi:hypothetical protein
MLQYKRDLPLHQLLVRLGQHQIHYLGRRRLHSYHGADPLGPSRNPNCLEALPLSRTSSISTYNSHKQLAKDDEDYLLERRSHQTPSLQFYCNEHRFP